MPEKDFLYDNAPLIEVIAEIRWALQNIMGSAGIQIDPHFTAFSEDFESAAKQLGFTHIEKLIPDNVPLEIVPKTVVFRYRNRPNLWPCMQIGPGVATANIVPPYQGWNEFRPHVRTMIDLLMRSYPLPERYLNIDRLELRYIDAFRKIHGMETPTIFVKNNLQIRYELPQELASICDGGQDKIELQGTFKFPLAEPQNAVGSVQVSTGTAHDEPATVAVFRVQQHDMAPELRGAERLTEWFDQAHGTIRGLFQAMISDETRRLMGPKKAIGD